MKKIFIKEFNIMLLKSKFKKSICFVLALTLCLSVTFSSVALATFTVKTSGKKDINPSKSEFKNAKNPKYNSKTETIAGNIHEKYTLDIHHWEAPEGGYYAFYTKGSLDTVEKVYEEDGVIKIDYLQSGYSDDAKIDKTGKNACIVTDVDKYEDYYICVRGYNDKTGKYKLRIEPNEDKTTYQNYGTWESDRIPSGSAVAGVWTSQKDYLTKEQAFLLYLMLKPNVKIIGANNKEYSLSYLNKLSRFKEEKDYSTLNNILMTVVSTGIGCANTGAGIAASAFCLVYSELPSKKSEKEKLIEALEKKCGIEERVYVASKTGKYSVKNGLLITTTFVQNSIPCLVNDYKAFNGSEIKGEKWYKGKWEFYEKK